MLNDLEFLACTPHPIDKHRFNPNAQIPYGCTVEHIHAAMNDFIDFLGFVNTQLYSKGISRLETMLMPANFSSMVSEFMGSAVPKYCKTVVKNTYHNGHPDLIPSGQFPDNAIQHANMGIEIKASRYPSGWQGHNAEEIWLMVFVFDSNRPEDAYKNILAKPFRFRMVLGAALAQTDWMFSGRSATSRRTITASVTKTGYAKMMANWIYKVENEQN